jgi:hypothetical protein
MKLFSNVQTSFENFDATIKTYLAKTFNSIGLQYTHNQLFGIIFDGIKGVMQNAMSYIEDALTEQNVYTAARKKSIYSLAKTSGYEAYYGSSAVGVIHANVQINNGLTENICTKVNIMNYCHVINKNTGIMYLIMLDGNKYVIDINAPLVTHEFKIVQGSIETAKYTARGYSLEKISVDLPGLFDRDYIEVYVDGEKWNQVSSLYDMTKDGKEYMLTVGYENTFDIIFGNGVYGMIPKYGSRIAVKYITHSGMYGNISDMNNAKFEFFDKGYDSYGNQVNLNEYIKLSLSTVVSGGTNADSIDFVRNMIGYNSRSNVFATEENFLLFFKRFSFIGQINCWSEKNTMAIMVACTNNVVENIKEYNDYFNLSEKDFLLTTKQKNMVINTLENSKKSFAGITLKFQDPIIRKFAIFCYIKCSSSYSKETIQEDIKNIFAKYFMNLKENTQFIPKSDLINLGSTCNDDIQSFDIDIISDMEEQAFFNGYYYTYKLINENNTYFYEKQKVYAESDSHPGLDIAGNIKLDTKLEIPVLGKFKYYPDKTTLSKNISNMNIQAINFFFL